MKNQVYLDISEAQPTLDASKDSASREQYKINSFIFIAEAPRILDNVKVCKPRVIQNKFIYFYCQGAAYLGQRQKRSSASMQNHYDFDNEKRG